MTPGTPTPKGSGDILDRNIGRLLRHAYVPALPDPAFRQRLLHTLGIENRRLARERGAAHPATHPNPGTTLPRWRRVGVVLATAAAVVLLAFGAFVTLRGEGATLERPDSPGLLARGDVAVQVGTEEWRAADAEELANGLVLGIDPVRVETPVAQAFAIATRAGRVDIEPVSSVQAATERDGAETILLAAGAASYEGPAGVVRLAIGQALRLIEGIPEATAVALAGPEDAGDRRPVGEAREEEEHPQAATPFATLAGDVRTASGEPVGDFRIGILRQRIGNEYDDPDTKDFENGTFVWEGIRPGRYRIYVSAADHALLDLGWVDLENEHVVDARLVSGGTIRGHVTDKATGNPVPGALVLSEEDAPADGLLLNADADTYQWLPTSTRTLADGSFELANVSPGLHSLRVNAEGYGALWVDDLAVAEDAVTEGVAVVLDSGATVEGRVTNADGSPRVGQQIIVAIMNDELRPHMNFGVDDTDVDGRYRVENLPAQMMFVIQVEKHIDSRPVVKPANLVAGETAVIDFLGAPAGTRVFGRVVGRDGRSLAHHNIALISKSASLAQLQDDFEASTTMPDGSFLFEGIAPGEYLLFMVEDMGRWVRLVDHFEVPDWPELERLVTVAELEVDGRVLDSHTGDPVAACGVYLELIEDGESIFAGNSLTDEKGHFELGLLNPGRYQVTAYPNSEELGFLKSESFVIDEASPSADVELQLTPGAAVEVHVVDPAGAPITGATVMFADVAGQGYMLEQFPTTDERGIYRAVGVRAGEIKALVGASGYAENSVLFQCRANQSNRVEVTLTPVASPEPAGEER